jgi:Right handed beta helix region
VNTALLSLALAISLTAGSPAPSSSASPNGSTGSGIGLIPTVPIAPVVPLLGGCAADPHTCGFPDATNTGVPAATTLKNVPRQISSGPGWYYDPRGWVEVDGNGAVLTGLYIPCNLDISASNVTVKDVEVEASGQSSFGISLRHTRDVTIENSTIEGDNTGNGRLMVGIKDIFGDATGTSVLDNNIMRTATGVQIYQGLIQGNFIHDMGYIDGDHINGITVSGGTTPLTIQDNTIFVDNGQTDAISLFQDTQVEANKVIKGNLLAGGGYAIYGGEGAQPASNIVIEDNRISTLFYPDGGLWGPVAYFSMGHGNVWSGNVWDSTGIAIPAP